MARDLPGRPHSPEPGIHLGILVRLSREEHRELAEVSYQMHLCAKRGKVGWLAEWARAHAQAGRILQRAIQRAHANPGLRRESDRQSES